MGKGPPGTTTAVSTAFFTVSASSALQHWQCHSAPRVLRSFKGPVATHAGKPAAQERAERRAATNTPFPTTATLPGASSTPTKSHCGQLIHLAAGRETGKALQGADNASYPLETFWIELVWSAAEPGRVVSTQHCALWNHLRWHTNTRVYRLNFMVTLYWEQIIWYFIKQPVSFQKGTSKKYSHLKKNSK